MIRVLIYRNSENKLCGYQIDGHADYAEEGEDIVCAAVSVLSENTANSIEKFVTSRISEYSSDGHLEFSVAGPVSDECGLLLKSFELGISDIAKKYGDKYIEIRYKEV